MIHVLIVPEAVQRNWFFFKISRTLESYGKKEKYSPIMLFIDKVEAVHLLHVGFCQLLVSFIGAS